MVIQDDSIGMMIEKEGKMEKCPIYIDHYERQVIIGIISGQDEMARYKMSDVFQQLIDEKSPVNMGAYELGFLTALVEEHRSKIPITWKQLMDMMNKFREDAGVKIIDLGNGLVQLIDDEGITMIREKHEWEK